MFIIITIAMIIMINILNNIMIIMIMNKFNIGYERNDCFCCYNN